MRILLDEQLPRQIAPYLLGHDVRTVQEESWAGLKNGELLTRSRVKSEAVEGMGANRDQVIVARGNEGCGAIIRAGGAGIVDLTVYTI